jgi:PAS domain S-box-containing protein
LQAIVDNSPVAIFIKDLQGRYLMMNLPDEKHFIGKTDHEVFPQETAERFVAHDREVLTNRTPTLHEELVPLPDGLHTDITIRFPLFDEAGVPYAVCGISTDITERKKAEALLEQLNTNLERQVRERTAQLQRLLEFEAMLKRITDKVRDSLDEAQILQTAVQEIAIGLNLACCEAAIYDALHATATICYEYTASMPSALGSKHRTIDRLEIYNELLQGHHLHLCRIVDTPESRSTAKAFAMLAYPQFDNEGLLGELWLFKPRGFRRGRNSASAASCFSMCDRHASSSTIQGSTGPGHRTGKAQST